MQSLCSASDPSMFLSWLMMQYARFRYHLSLTLTEVLTWFGSHDLCVLTQMKSCSCYTTIHLHFVPTLAFVFTGCCSGLLFVWSKWSRGCSKTLHWADELSAEGTMHPNLCHRVVSLGSVQPQVGASSLHALVCNVYTGVYFSVAVLVEARGAPGMSSS